MEKIIYIKLLEDYNDITTYKLPMFIKKIILYLKKFFSIMTKNKIEGFTIWTLPFEYIEFNFKIEKVIGKVLKNVEENSILVLSKDLKKKEIYEVLDKFDIKYVTGNIAKKELLFKVLEYINKIQNKEQKDRDVTILVDKNTARNMAIINRLALECKSIKIVSKASNGFRKLEEKLYNENGIAMQFSNNNRKSLKNSNLIINMDFNEEQINKYNINPNAIIINTENKVKIKAKFFNGILINSYNIEFLDRPISKDFKAFECLDIYESLMIANNSANEKSIKILNVIGNNGIIECEEMGTVPFSTEKWTMEPSPFPQFPFPQI